MNCWRWSRLLRAEVNAVAQPYEEVGHLRPHGGGDQRRNARHLPGGLTSGFLVSARSDECVYGMCNMGSGDGRQHGEQRPHTADVT